MSDLIVETSKGRVQGVRVDQSIAFLGIPYGADTRATRWRRPGPVQPWEGVRDATVLGPICPQGSAPGGRSPEVQALFGGGDPTGLEQSEDCLRVNVWTPSTRGRGRPVMVWLHGGAFAYGLGTAPGDDAPTHGAMLAAFADAVVVTVNNRLGIFGHLHLGELFGDDYATSGNTGLLDMADALAWVHDEIAAFGGDSSRVLVFGQSGGAGKAHTLAAMPAARPYMHAMALQSGLARQFHTSASATEVAGRLLDELGVDRLDDLLALPTEALQAVQDADRAKHGPAIGLQTFYPVVDGISLPRHPTEAGITIPVLVGSTKDEVDLVMKVDEDLDDAGLEEAIAAFEGARAPSLIDTYRRSRPTYSPANLYREIQTERLFRLPAVRLAEQLALAGVPVWSYVFTYDSPAFAGRSPHALDIPFVFRTVGKVRLTGDRPDRWPLADAMAGAWAAFARHGDPNHDGLPSWPPYDLDRRATMLFDQQCRVELDHRSDERQAWLP